MKIEIFPPISIYELGQRTNQEDAIVQWENRLFVLCDGMGGHEKGEVASQTVCAALVEWFSTNNPSSLPDEQLKEALEYAYQKLDEKDDGSLKKMGTTLTLLYIGNQGVVAAHIGDSRIYHIRPNIGVLYQSRDHSLVFDLFQAGEISYEEMATHPQKNIITRAMTPGIENRTRPDIIHIADVQSGDFFYMCSDGMLENESLDKDGLFAIFSAEMDDDAKRFYLYQGSKDSRDNHSAWIIHIKDVLKEDGDEALINEESTARCNAINLMPKKSEEVVDDVTEVQVAEDVDDVEVVSEAPKPITKKKVSMLKLILALIVLLAVFFAAWHFLSNDDEDQEEETHSEYYFNKMKR